MMQMIEYLREMDFIHKSAGVELYRSNPIGAFTFYLNEGGCVSCLALERSKERELK